MDETLHAARDAPLTHVAGLIERGQQLRDALITDPQASRAIRAWQEHCGALVNQLSGGSKAHWLSRAFSDALLVRTAGGDAVEEASLDQIVDRVIAVLEGARKSLLDLDTTVSSGGESAAPIRRFDFVHNVALRPVFERAYLDSRAALARGDFGAALMISSGLLEALVTDALEHRARESRHDRGRVDEGIDRSIAEWTFEARLEAAKQSGLIGGGFARLPAVARGYRQLADQDGELRPGVEISDRDARVTAQVMNVIIRDLDPGR